MKSIYEAAYKRIISENKNNKNKKGLHRHRIVPGYAGGKYIDENIVHLSQKEHSLVHWLRWKLYGDERDKRAYKMIGYGPSGLSYDDRVKHGKKCYENNIGFHDPAYSNERKEWRLRGINTQKLIYENSGEKNFYYWTTKEGRKERAKLGGEKGYKNNVKFQEQQGRFKDKDHARTCGLKAGKLPVYNNKMIRKFKTEEEREIFLSNNPHWKKGTGISPQKGKKLGPSPMRKKVTNGVLVFTSVKEAALHYGVTSATIINWCRSSTKEGWKYV